MLIVTCLIWIAVLGMTLVRAYPLFNQPRVPEPLTPQDIVQLFASGDRERAVFWYRQLYSVNREQALAALPRLSEQLLSGEPLPQPTWFGRYPRSTMLIAIACQLVIATVSVTSESSGYGDSFRRITTPLALISIGVLIATAGSRGNQRRVGVVR